MRLLALVLAGYLYILGIVHGEGLTLIRHFDGDIFTLEGSCKEACTELSSGTASPYSRSPSTAGLVTGNSSCTCQCNVGLPTFREDLHICVNDIHECNVAGFVSSTGQIERVPYVFLPQRGQIIYPQAEIRFEGVTTPVCGIAGAQQLGKAGWFELRNLSDAEPPFRLFRDEGRTFLQWIGEAGLRDAAEGRVVIAKLVCRDASPKSSYPGVFTPCVAFRVAGSPSKSNVREVMFSATSQVSQGLSATEYTAIGLSSVILALIYVASVSLYLHSRKAKRKSIEEPEATLSAGRDGGGLVKSNPLLGASRHFESDTNSGLTESDLGDDLSPSDGEQGFENITSAIVHPHCIYLENSEGLFGSGSILGERLPEEDVRVVETVDSAHQQDVPVLPGAQRRKLYFNPAYFDRQLLLAPPPAAIEFLLKIREVISIAKHKMAAKRFVPTLNGIPEEESGSERSTSRQQRTSGAGSVQGSVARSRKSQRCTGCPGCSESFRNLPALPESEQTNPGESKVRAWLEDVRPPLRRWQDGAEDARKNFQENARTFAKSLEYLKEMARRDLGEPDGALAGKPVSVWKENPPMLRTFQNIAMSEILDNEDRQSVSRRSTKSMFEESNYSRFHRGTNFEKNYGFHGDDAINAKVRKAIENSFIKQMEENAALDSSDEKDRQGEGQEQVDGGGVKSVKQESTPSKKVPDVSVPKKSRKCKAPSIPTKKELPDMINELPGAKNTAKRIMDAVIREMVDVKSLDQVPRTTKITEYEVDSLERSKCSRKSSTSPESTDQSSPALSTALPMDEELTMQNAIINARTGKMTMSKLNKDVLEKNYYNTLPELLSSQRSETYSLVSEVYVNDGYASPEGSDDSGPEIQYEPENPGHLTIKVQDSPENYVKQDESEYEPDTLDRKPMKLKINGDVNYDREPINEVYVDSLERPAQILLRSKGSFRDEDVVRTSGTSLQRGYGSLREIYEARIRSNLKDSKLISTSSRSLNGEPEKTLSWKKCKYLTPESRHAKRQRQHNQPDVVPLPPTEEIYQRPKPPRRVEGLKASPTSSLSSKNAWDRSPVEAGDPTASNGAPVPKDYAHSVGKSCSCNFFYDDENVQASAESVKSANRMNRPMKLPTKVPKVGANRAVSEAEQTTWVNLERMQDKRRLIERRSRNAERVHGRSRHETSRKMHCEAEQHCSRFHGSKEGCRHSSTEVFMRSMENRRQNKVEDSGYLSSTDSNGSHKRLLRHEVSSVSETDETESVCDGASESGAESVGTDSVFFGNFRRLSEVSSFSKSVDSGVDLGARNPYLQPFGVRNDSGILERINFSTSDSETESFVTVLPPGGSQRNSIAS